MNTLNGRLLGLMPRKEHTLGHKKKTQTTSNIKYYYKELHNHRGVSPNDKNSKKYLISISIMDLVLLLISILLTVFRNSEIVSYITDNSEKQYILYFIMLIYAFLVSTSYTIYQICLYTFEKKQKHELIEKNLRFPYNLMIFVLNLIHLPWILSASILLFLLKKLKIDNLKMLLPLVVCGYMYFLMFSLIMIQLGCRLLDYLITVYPFLTNSLINDTTYVYILLLFTILLCKHIPTAFLKLSVKHLFPKNSIEYRRTFRQYHLLNYYFLIVVTLILKALNFEGADKILVDALFYTTTCMALVTTAKEKASNS